MIAHCEKFTHQSGSRLRTNLLLSLQKNSYETTSCAKFLPPDVFEIFKPVIEKKSYCAHSKIILINMIFGE